MKLSKTNMNPEQNYFLMLLASLYVDGDASSQKMFPAEDRVGPHNGALFAIVDTPKEKELES